MTYREHMRRSLRAYWKSLLKQTNGNLTEAARRAGVQRGHAYKLLQRAGIARGQLHRGNAEWRALSATESSQVSSRA